MPQPYGGGIGANIASQLNLSVCAPGSFNTFVPSTLLTSLVHRWALDETSGNRVDAVGGATLTDVNTVTSDATGPFSKAAVFTKANAEKLTKMGFVFPNNFTYSVWTYWNSSDIAGLPTLMSCQGSFLNNAQLTVYGAHSGVDQLNAYGTDVYTNVAMASYWTDEWHLFTITFDADNKMRVYLDTVLMATGVAIATPYRTAQTLEVGGPGGGTISTFGGKQSEILIHSVVLTQAQIDEMYLAAKYHALRVGTTLPAPKPTIPTPDIWLTYGDSKTANEYYQTPLKNFMANNTPAVGVTYGPSFTGFTDGELAIGGSTVASMKALIDTHLTSAGPTIPTKILCNLGINDAIAGLPAEATWEGNYGYILDAMHVKWPSAKIYLMRPWGRTEDADCDTIATWITVVLATRNTFAFVGPDERVFLKGSNDGTTFTSDGVHPNARGGSLTAENWLVTLGY